MCMCTYIYLLSFLNIFDLYVNMFLMISCISVLYVYVILSYMEKIKKSIYLSIYLVFFGYSNCVVAFCYCLLLNLFSLVIATVLSRVVTVCS